MAEMPQNQPDISDSLPRLTVSRSLAHRVLEVIIVDLLNGTKASVTICLIR